MEFYSSIAPDVIRLISDIPRYQNPDNLECIWILRPHRLRRFSSQKKPALRHCLDEIIGMFSNPS